MSHGWFAAVGTDGRSPVVWGVGACPKDALSDAGKSFEFSVLTNGREALVVKDITEQQYNAVINGVVSVAELGIELDASDLKHITPS